MDVAAHNFTDTFKAGKIKTIQRSQSQLLQIAVEILVQYPAGSPANQGNIHCYNEAYKGCVAAFIDGSNQIFIGLFSETFQSDDFITVGSRWYKS